MSLREADGSRLRRAAMLAGAGVALAVWGTWPLATCLDRCVAAPPAGGIWWIDAALRRDVDLIVWILAWGAHALGTAPGALFDANVFHPAPQALTTTEHLLGLQVLYLPLRLVTGDPVAAHQATLLATFAAAFGAMALLVRAWSGSWIAGAAAGVLYAFSPFRARYLPALHMESAWLLPLIVLAAERVASGAAGRWTLAFGAALAVQALSSYYLAYASAVAVAVLLGAALADARARPYAWRLAAATVAALGVVAACSVPYLRAQAGGALAAADPQYVAAVSAAPGRTGATLAVLLAIVTAPWWRGGDVRPLWLVALALAGVLAHLLALGPVIHVGSLALPGPYALVQAIVPGFGLVRGPERLNVVTTAAAAALAGIGVAGVSRRLALRSPRLGGAALAAALAVALASVPATMRWPVPTTRLPAAVPPVYPWLARAAPGPVLELPWHDFQSTRQGLAAEARRLRLSTVHWKPLLGGYSGYVPPSYPLVSALAGALPDARALALLVRATGVRWIVLHRDELDRTARRRWRAARALVRPVAVLGRDVVLEPRAPAVPDLVAALRRGTGETTLLGTPVGPLAGTARRAALTFDAPVPGMPWLDPIEVGVAVTNRGDAAWPATTTRARHRVTLGYRWLDGCERVLDARDDAGRLPWDAAPGETVPARVVVHRARAAGVAALAVGVVQDGVWMEGTARTRFVPPDPDRDCAAGAGRDGPPVTSSRRLAAAGRGPAAACPGASSRCTASP